MPHIHIPMPAISNITGNDKYRFWTKVQRRGDCYIWIGSSTLAPDGSLRGHFRLKNRVYLAPRVSYFLEYKIDPGQQLVLHECNVSLCIRPDHLNLGSYSDNMIHRVDSGRHPRGDLTPKSVLAEHQIPIILQRYKNGENGSMIAKSLGVNNGTIYPILRGDSWKHVPRK